MCSRLPRQGWVAPSSPREASYSPRSMLRAECPLGRRSSPPLPLRLCYGPLALGGTPHSGGAAAPFKSPMRGRGTHQPRPKVADSASLKHQLNLILPNEQPSLTSAKTDGECVQLIVSFTASVAQLRAWQQSDMPAARLFTKWVAGWAESPELKERLKLLSKVAT